MQNYSIVVVHLADDAQVCEVSLALDLPEGRGLSLGLRSEERRVGKEC